MNQEELMAFLMIVNCKSISLAAKKLYISQPALSNRLHTLEKKLGYPLIQRKKGCHDLILTEEGKTFVPIARKSQELWTKAQSIPEQSNQNVLRIAATSSVSNYILPNVIHSFLAKDTNTSLRLLSCRSDDGYKIIEDGTADLAIVSSDFYYNILETYPAYRTKMVCVSGNKSNFSKIVDITTLAPEKEIQVPWFPDYDNWRRNTIPILSTPHIFISSMILMESLICEDYWCLMPSTIAHRLHKKDIIISDIKNHLPDQHVFLLKKRGEINDSMQQFINCLDQELSSIEGTSSYLKNI